MNPAQPAFLQDDIDSQTNRSAKPLAPFRIPGSLFCKVQKFVVFCDLQPRAGSDALKDALFP